MVKPGDKAKIYLVNKNNQPILIGRKIGKGKVVYAGEIFGVNKKDNAVVPRESSWKMLFHLILSIKHQRVNQKLKKEINNYQD